MPIRCLIVDDTDLKEELLTEILRSAFDAIDIQVSQSYGKAIQHLNTHFDLVLVDQVLGDGFGRTFVSAYRKLWPNSYIRLYSNEPECVEQSDGIKCYPWDAIKGEILSAKIYFDNEGKNLMTPSIEREIMGEPFNQKLCDEKHKNTDITLARIEVIVGSLSKKLDWFYVFAIVTLVSALSSVVVSCIK